ncbi:MAG: sigma factor [Ginsengibacter sp.]
MYYTKSGDLSKPSEWRLTYSNMPGKSLEYDPRIEFLYDQYSPKVFGFISQYTDSKELAEQFLINVFLKVWEDIENFDVNPDKKIQQIVLLLSKPICKSKQMQKAD